MIMKPYCRRRLTEWPTGSRTLSYGMLFYQFGRILSLSRYLICQRSEQPMTDTRCLLPTNLHPVKVTLRQYTATWSPYHLTTMPGLVPPRAQLDQAKVFAMTLPSLLALNGVTGVGNI